MSVLSTRATHRFSCYLFGKAMKPLPVTNDDLAAFLASKMKKEVYRGFSAFEVLAREREIWRFFIYVYAVFAYLAGIGLAKFGDPRFGSLVILIPLPLGFLFQRQRRLDDFLFFFLTRNSSPPARQN